MIKPTPYLELASTCFRAAKWMKEGDAAEAVRARRISF
jgi:hypothetical protein